MDDGGLVESTKEEIKGRLKGSYAGAYFLALCAVNYEFLIVAFSSGDYSEKIGYIARHLYYGQSPLHTFGLPALIACGAVVTLPMLNSLANLWTKAVQILEGHLVGRLEARKWISDPELRKLIRIGQSERDALRSYAHETLRLYWPAAALDATRLTEPPTGWQVLPKAGHQSTQFNPATTQILTIAGFPSIGYRMLRSLEVDTRTTEDGLLASGEFGGGRQERRQILAFMTGLRFIECVWTEGGSPVYTLTKGGREFLTFVTEHHPAVF